MRQSLEGYFLVNFTVDAALICIVARANGCFRLWRVLPGSLVCAIYALLAETLLPQISHPAVQLLLLALTGILITGEPDWRQWGAVSFQLFCAAMMLGGFVGLTPEAGPAARAAAICAGLLFLYLLLSVRRKRIASWEVTVFLRFRERCVSFRALIDTGNRLREPVSGLPVLIAEEALLSNLFSGCKRPAFRTLSFGALGGGGTIRCFHPDSVMIRRSDRLVPAPDVWVAVYPGAIPGSARALAPPSFAVLPGKS